MVVVVVCDEMNDTEVITAFTLQAGVLALSTLILLLGCCCCYLWSVSNVSTVDLPQHTPSVRIVVTCTAQCELTSFASCQLIDLREYQHERHFNINRLLFQYSILQNMCGGSGQEMGLGSNGSP